MPSKADKDSAVAPPKTEAVTKTVKKKAVKKVTKKKAVQKEVVAPEASTPVVEKPNSEKPVEAKKKPARKKTSGRLKIRQLKSGIGSNKPMKRTLAAMGLKHHQDHVELPDNPAVRGMINKVRHLVEVTAAEE